MNDFFRTCSGFSGMLYFYTTRQAGFSGGQVGAAATRLCSWARFPVSENEKIPQLSMPADCRG